MAFAVNALKYMNYILMFCINEFATLVDMKGTGANTEYS
jgi:hypothetical protein